MPARKELTITKQDKFLKKYSETRAFRLSLEEAPVTRKTVKRWLAQDSYGFREKWIRVYPESVNISGRIVLSSIESNRQAKE